MYDLILFLFLLLLGYVFGQRAEKRHFRSIIEREAQLGDILVFSERKIPDEAACEGILVAGSVVVSVDYFKRFVADLRNFFGGRVSAYESLLERARREAVLRMKEAARRKGADSVWNLRLETASIYKGAAGSVGAVEIIAYGTAVRQRR